MEYWIMNSHPYNMTTDGELGVIVSVYFGNLASERLNSSVDDATSRNINKVINKLSDLLKSWGKDSEMMQKIIR